MTYPRQVLHIFGSLDVGGAELVALDVCRAISPDEVQQTFVCLANRRGTLAPEFEEAGARVLLVDFGARILFWFKFYSMLRRERPAVVVSHVSLASGPLLFTSRLARVPSRIAFMRSSGDGKPQSGRRGIYRVVCRFLLRVGATTIAGVSSPALEFAFGDPGGSPKVPRSAKVIPNGVDTHLFHLAIESFDRSIVLHVGRASPEKNRQKIVDAFSVLNDGRDTKLLLVGPGGTNDLTLPLPRGTQALGSRRDVASLMQGAGVLVLPSFREGLPNVVLQALASGLPVVASDIPALRAMARRFEGIALVGLDQPDSEWAEAIERALLADTAMRRSIRQSLVDSEYTLDHSAEAWRRIWRG